MDDIPQSNLLITIQQPAINQPMVAAILPSYNEAERIGRVLSTLQGVSSLSEIVVVDDGSQDNTPMIAEQAALDDPRIRLLCHAVNQGKGQAIFSGWRSTQAPYLLLLDTDLEGLKPEHVDLLIRPVLEQPRVMTIGVFRGGRFSTDFSHWTTPWLSGQRCFASSLLKAVPQDAARGYGFETALTLAARQCGWKIQKVALRGVFHPPSEFHRGFVYGLATRIRMYAQIIRAWFLFQREKKKVCS